MKKKILKITTIMIMFTLVYVSIVNALSFTATITPSSTTVAESTEFTVKIKVSNLDVGTNGINSLSGYLKYDKDVFETITDCSFSVIYRQLNSIEVVGDFPKFIQLRLHIIRLNSKRIDF